MNFTMNRVCEKSSMKSSTNKIIYEHLREKNQKQLPRLQSKLIEQLGAQCQNVRVCMDFYLFCESVSKWRRWRGRSSTHTATYKKWPKVSALTAKIWQSEWFCVKSIRFMRTRWVGGQSAGKKNLKMPFRKACSLYYFLNQFKKYVYLL